MKIVMVSNRVNHHVLPLCRELRRLLGEGFSFVETVPQGGEDAYQLGYAHFLAEGNPTEPWIIRGWENRILAEQVIWEADGVLTLNCGDDWVMARLKAGKLTFRAHERWYRRGLPWYRVPRARIGGWLHHGRFPSLYLLAASAYGAADARRAGCFRGKAYRWGYFPEFRTYTREELEQHKEHPLPLILWAGRFIPEKHPEDAIQACEKLRQAGYRFRLAMAGSGPLEEELRDLADFPVFLGFLSPEELRTRMERADIFLMTGDFREGWGAVLNEAMNSGCAVVSSHGPGAAPWLIRDGENGLLYASGDVEGLCGGIRKLLEDAPLRRDLGWRAYETVRDGWTPAIAAERLVDLCHSLLAEGTCSRREGLCSPASVLQNNWYPGTCGEKE